MNAATAHAYENEVQMADKTSVQKMLVLLMIVSFGISLTSFISGVLALLLKGEPGRAARSFMISFCFAAAGSIFRRTIKMSSRPKK
ncbi:MAG: hypothetical protein LBT84_03835 [Spirochaetia bacterium]|nr:hypothetical protein [Spirochaetia bacterium]